MAHEVTPAALSVPDAAAYLGISQAAVHRLIRARRLPAKRLGRSVRIPRVWLDRWLASDASELPEGVG